MFTGVFLGMCSFSANRGSAVAAWFLKSDTANVKVKEIPQQAEVAQGVLGRLRTRIFLTFGTTRVVGRQPYAPAAFTPGEIPGTHFQRLSRPQGTWLCRGEPRKKSPVTPPGIDPGTVWLVAQRLNHYATPDEGACRVLVGRPEGIRPLVRPRRRREDNIKMDLPEEG